jgi:hypothetical protein
MRPRAVALLRRRAVMLGYFDVVQCFYQNLKKTGWGCQKVAGPSSESHKKGIKMGHFASCQIKTEKLFCSKMVLKHI